MTNCTLPMFETHKGRPLMALLVGCLFGFVAAPVQAQCTTTWTHAANGFWWTPGNWTPAAVPNSATETVCIVDGSSIVQLNASAGVGSLQIAAGNTLQILNATGLAMAGVPSTLNNAGTIALQSTGGAADLIINNGSTVTLSGGGLVTLSDHASLNNRIYTNAKGSVLDNIDNTISGAGQIFKNAGMVLKNQVGGVIDASGTNVLRLSNFSGIDTGVDYTLVNNGILRSTNTGGLVLFNTHVDNTGNGSSGRIHALGDGFHVDLQGASIRGGTLSTSGTGVIQTISDGNGLDGSGAAVNITAGSTIRVNNATALSLVGTFNNAGTIALNSTGGAADLIIGSGTVTLQGGGLITLSDHSANRVYTNTPGTVLNNVDHVISGAGDIFTNQGLKIINAASGVINASGVNALKLRDFSGAYTLANSGILRSTNTGGLVLQSTTVDNAGGGRITALSAGTHVDLNGATIRGGTLTTSGGGLIQTVGNGGLLDGSAATVNIATGSTIRVNNGTDLSLVGTFNNAGTIQVNASPSTTNLIIGSGTVTLQGGGLITLSDHSANRVYTNTPGTVLNNVDHVISGAGDIFTNQGLKIINAASGVINASGVNALKLRDFSGAYTLANSGILRSTNTGGLVLQSTTVDNAGGGRITALGAGTHVDLNGATIRGGTLTTSGGGLIQTVGNGGLLDGSAATVNIATGSTVQVNNNTGLSLAGIIDNAGTIAVNSTGQLTSLQFANGTQLTGGGAITLSDGANNLLWGTTNTGLEVVTNVDNTISGAGLIGYSGSMLFINQGLINATGTTALTIHPTTNNGSGLITANGGGFVNQGTLQASGAGGLVLDNGQFNNKLGLIEAGNGSSVSLKNVTVSGGTLQSVGSGLVQTVGGQTATLDGTSQGMLTIVGNYLANNNSQTFVSGTINNTGTITVASGGNLTNLRFADGTQLTGRGAIVLSDNANNLLWGTTNSGVEIVTNVDNTISGAGLIGYSGSMLFINQGLINATGTTALTIHPTTNNGSGLITANGGGFVNQGTLQASGAGGLVLDNGQFNNKLGLIEAGSGSSVSLKNVTVSGGTLQSVGSGLVQTVGGQTATLDGASQGTLTIAGNYLANNNSQTFVSGTINNTGTITVNSTGNATYLQFADGTQLTGGGAIVLSDSPNNLLWGTTNSGLEVVTNVNNTISGAGLIGYSNAFRLVNGGVIDATGTNALILSPTPNPAVTTALLNQAGGVLRGSGAGGLSITRGNIDNQGTVEALANSSVTYGTSAVTMNNVAGTLTGGLWRADAVGGAAATITLRGSNITTNAADIYLRGAGSNINVAGTSIDTTLHTNAAAGALRLQNGRAFNAIANGGNFSNNGILELTDSTFTANTLANSGAIQSFGNSTLTTALGNQVTGSGSISSSFGTLTITRGVNMGAGSSMTSNVGAAVDLSNAAAASQIGTLANNGALNLGTQNIVVTKDYSNASFGSGNSFNARANVSGAGLVLGNLAAQGITGDVTSAGANTWTLSFGAIRGGTSRTVNYQIANTGTGADIRGAVQTAASGASVTDGRLSGTGVTAANFGPIAAAGNSGNLAVTFTATSGGSLTGQSIAVVSNFDNVTKQIINLSGNTSALAVGNATPSPGPVNLGNFRVGSQGAITNFAVQNTTVGAGAEQLGIDSASASSGFTASNAFGGGLIAAGASQAAAITARANGSGTAGLNTGTVTIQYATDGTNIESSFTRQNANQQTIAVQATGYNAAAGAASPSPINLGNFRVGVAGGVAPQSQNVAVTNTVAGPFTESLGIGSAGVNNAAFSLTNNLGSGLIAAGGSNAAALNVSRTGGVAGLNTGTLAIQYTSDGTGTSGLAAINANGQNITVNATGYNLAQATINNPLDFNLGNVLVGGGQVTRTVSLSNTGPLGAFTEALNAQFGTIVNSGVGNVGTNGGSISGLLAGQTDAISMQVIYTPTAQGSINASITLNLQSNGTAVGNGLGLTNLPDQLLSLLGTVTGTAGTLAIAGPATPNPVNFGNVRVNAVVADQVLSISNLANAPAEGLNASISTATAGLTASGSFTGLAPQGTNNTELRVGMTTGTAGSRNGTATITQASDGTFNNGVTTPLGTQTITVTGGVFQVAQPGVPTDVSLGNFRLGSGPSQAITIANTSNAPAGYQEGLDASVKATGGQATAGGGPIGNLAQGGTSNAISVGINSATATAGANSGTVTLALASNGATTSGLSTLGLADAVINVGGTGYRLANPTLNTTTVTIAARVGDAAAANRGVSITNTSPDIYTEGLKVTITGSSGNAQHNGGSIANLAAQGTNGTSIQVGLASTATAGQSSGSVNLKFDSTGAGTTGAPDTAAQTASGIVNVIGNVYQRAVGAVVGAIDFGIVRVGQLVGAKDATVSNTATQVNGGAYNDTLAAQFASSGVGKFITNGSASGIAAAGGTNAAGSMTVGLNTAQAGNLSETQQVNFRGENGEMADDLTLSSGSLIMTAQVNNWANPVFGKTSGAGIFSCSGLVCSLNLGDIVQGSGPLATELFLKNDVVNPADSLKGIFDLSLVNDFGQSGWIDPTDLTPGAVLNGLALTYDPLALGSFSDTIYFGGFSFNSSDPNGAALSRFTVNLYANVVQQGGSAPEPGTIAMILLAAGLAYGARRRQTKAH